MHTVILYSEPYGGEKFTYDTFDEAMEGVIRLSKAALEGFTQDGIEREVTYVTSDETEDEPADH
jgi:hypothetical protein